MNSKKNSAVAITPRPDNMQPNKSKPRAEQDWRYAHPLANRTGPSGSEATEAVTGKRR